MTLKGFNNGAHKKKIVLSLLDDRKFRSSKDVLEILRKNGYEWRRGSSITSGGCRKSKKIKTELGRIRSLGNYLSSLSEVEVKQGRTKHFLFRKKTS